MKSPRILAPILLLLCLAGWRSLATAEEGSLAAQRAALEKTMQAGNFKDAYDGLRKLALDPANDPKLVGRDLNNALSCLQRLNRVNEIDAFREQVIKVHAKNWRLLWTAAQSYMNYEHHGFMIAGEFRRGRHRGGGEWVSAVERDRIRALQLMVQAMPLAADENNKPEVAGYYLSLAQMLLNQRGYQEAWRLQYLSALATLPDYEPGRYRNFGRTSGAPVDEEGKPVYHHAPKTWDDAATDGQRWRFALDQAVELSPALLNQVRMDRANFLHSQFGVQTMAYYGRFFGRSSDGSKQQESGTYQLHTLAENETIARLATGIRRFTLPDEFNYIKIYQSIVADDATGYGVQAIEKLAQVFENRRQYPRAADLWRQDIAKNGKTTHRQQRLSQIVDNWGRFETVQVQPAGKGATVELRFRNGRRVEFEAHQIKVAKLLADVQAYINSNPARLDWNRFNIQNLGYRLVTQNQKQYLGDRVAQWGLDLEPAKDHFDRRITITSPLQKAGAYLLTAKLADGNTSKIILWLADTAIVKKPLAGKAYYFVADAVTGKPIEKANLAFFGYFQEHLGKGKYRIHTKQFAEFTDADGQVLQEPPAGNNYQWLVTATTESGRFAYLGFTSVWRSNYYDAQYNQVKVFSITDRPVYRPDQTVKYKFWVRHAQYDKDEVSQFAGQTFAIQINNPKGEKVLTKSVQADEYGGIEGEYQLPHDAPLGVYRYAVVGRGGGSFRVEEYKKPEFEVAIEAPTEPVMLGEKITATIRAKYYFGSPVTSAKVKYKVLRTNYTKTWYPVGRWDWLYGRGYWWFAYDYRWYPGWQVWGCERPAPWWFSRSQSPPEVVAERETQIGEDGTVQVDIDTAIAKAIHPDQDHSYQIVAEVVDESRRTIVGTGKVLVARQPFRVFSWVNRGYYRTGDVIRANFSARTLDDKPVRGKGELTIFKITYDENHQPIETPVRTWPLDTNDEGMTRLQMRASLNGQFRLSYKVTDAAEHTIEGGYIFTIIGEDFDGADFRFNELELVTDKREYHPGEIVKLQVNTNRLGGTVLLFVRPSNGVYLPPRVIRLEGKSTVVDVGVVKKDMPNFFIEAATVSAGRVFSETREVHVPPEKRVLDIAVLPSAEEYKPGEHATVQVKLTDHDGKPFVGSTVLAIYDKSVEYISGGSNVAAIKEFFWNWRRRHSINTETNLRRYFSNLTLPKQPGMGNLGVFGANVADEVNSNALKDEAKPGAMRQQSKAFGDAVLSEAAAAPMDDMAENESRDAGGEGGGGGPGGGGSADPLVEAVVRTNFADTALWKGSLETNKDGVAEVELDMPENLTTWKVRCWGMGHGTRVGQGEAEVLTRKNLIVRMQAPRFFVEKDEVVLSANVHNYLTEKKQAQASLELDGPSLVPMGELTQTVEIEENGEARVDWRVKVVAEGTAVVRMKALTDEESDAMQFSFPVYVHGMLKMDSYSGALRPDDKLGQFTIRVPAARRINESRLEVRYSPTLAGAMVDALPYLVDYPYGCTEQTLNRFLPAVITQKVLLDMGLDLEEIRKKRTNLNAQEIGDDRARAKGWKRFKRNPVFNQQELNEIVKEGVARLTNMQLSDGGWGWFSGWGERSYPHTTAVVVHGLQTAKANDLALVPGMLERGVAWLTRYQNEQVRRLQNADGKKRPYKLFADNLDALVYMVLVDADVKNGAMLNFLYRDRTKLAVYSNAMFGLALHKQQELDKLAMIMQNIRQFVVEDDENQAAYLNLPEGNWWYWYGSEYEAHAYYLKLLAATEPKSRLPSRLVKYLLNNRKHATYWNSTRDTALVIEAMADFLRASGENRPDMTVEIWMDGKKQQEVQISAENLFTFDNKFVRFGDAVETGEHTIELRKQGTGPLYYNGYLTNFTLEDHIEKAGLEIKVERNVYKLRPVDKKIKAAGSRGQVVDQKVEKYERDKLADLATLKSGDLVEIELVIESKNDYEYIIIEDMKAAGFEPVEVRSGYNGNALGAYMELRDNRVTFLVNRLARGKHSVAYRMRAEIPGRFAALPTRASAMYAPELKANSDEIKLRIED